MPTTLRTVTLLLLAVTMSNPAVAGDKKAADPNKRICRGLEQTGSIFTHQVCHTRAEWAQIASQNDADTARTVQTNRLQSPSQEGTRY